jgi:hypothetical protein
MKPPQEVEEMELYAWVGRDELNEAGEYGLKHGSVPAGMIPMVSVHQWKLDQYWDQAERQAWAFGQRIYLVRFTVTKVVRGTKYGE